MRSGPGRASRPAVGTDAGTCMYRRFLGLAIANGTFLALTFALGLWATSETIRPGAPGRGLHFLFGLWTTMFTLAVHSIAFTYFLGTGKWIKEVARVYGLPEWLEAQAIKNKRRAFPFELWGMVLVGVTAWMGAGTDTQGWPAVWHLALASLALAFNVGAFAVEYSVIVAQARLLLEVKDQADRLRLAQVGARAEPA